MADAKNSLDENICEGKKYRSYIYWEHNMAGEKVCASQNTVRGCRYTLRSVRLQRT